MIIEKENTGYDSKKINFPLNLPNLESKNNNLIDYIQKCNPNVNIKQQSGVGEKEIREKT